MFYDSRNGYQFVGKNVPSYYRARVWKWLARQSQTLLDKLFHAWAMGKQKTSKRLSPQREEGK